MLGLRGRGLSGRRLLWRSIGVGRHVGRRVGWHVGRRQRLPYFEPEFFEGAVIGALAGIDDALETLKGGGIGGEGLAGSAGQSDFDILYDEGVVGALPEAGFDAAHAAEAPFVVNQGVDEKALMGIGGAVMFVVLGGELGEIFRVLVEHDLVDGVDAVLQGVEAGCGFGPGGARPGVFLCIQAIRLRFAWRLPFGTSIRA
jgi:hypothetical protein